MGRARRQRMLKKRHVGTDRSTIYADAARNEAVDAEMKALGLPLSFESTKGKHIEGQVNVEAARVGQLRRFQQFQGKKLREWQIRRLKGTRLRQVRERRQRK